MILDDILPQCNSGSRLLFTTQTAFIMELCTILCKSLMLALQPSEISDAVTMLTAGAEMSEESTAEASYADLECLIQSVGNLLLAINKAASYIKGYKSSMKELLMIYIKVKR